MSVEKYLRPEIINQIKRLDLRAQFVARGFMQGLHSSPYQGFSVEFSEHRKYSQGDDPNDIDWQVYAKTDKYYVKKFEAETTITGFVMMDLSESMGYTYRQPMSKFEYSICLAAALCYLMIAQQDPVGLITFDTKIRESLPPKSKRSQLGNIISLLSKIVPTGETDIAHSIHQMSAMIKHKSLIMIFSDLLVDPEPVVNSLLHLRHGGHDVILFHVLDEAEVAFPFDGMCNFENPENQEHIKVDAYGFRKEYLDEIEKYREHYKTVCHRAGVDYVPLDTSMSFDNALMKYLLKRRMRGI